MTESLTALSAKLWGAPLLALLLGTGMFLTVRTGFGTWRNLPGACALLLSPGVRHSDGGISPLAALMTALASTLGTGNIVGVATALTAGGPGALVWMEISALFGLAAKFSECALAVRFRRRGERSGGPMVVMARGMRPRLLGRAMGGAFALFAVGASFGMGNMAQTNAMATALEAAFSVPPWVTAAAAGLATLAVIRGGIGRIAGVSGFLVPLMALGYLGGAGAVIIGHWQALPAAVGQMFAQALGPEAVLGGAAGAAMRYGVARGIFSNEAGMGSAAIAAAAADGDCPALHGYINMVGAFFDTCVVCTVTGLAICCSGVLETANGADGAALTILAFESVLGRWGGALVAVCVALFSFSSVLGWAYQGETALVYLTGGRGRMLYRRAFALAAFVGAVSRLETVFALSDICNALMAVPNLLCLLALSATAAREMEAFEPAVRKRKKL